MSFFFFFPLAFKIFLFTLSFHQIDRGVVGCDFFVCLFCFGLAEIPGSVRFLGLAFVGYFV